MYLFITYIFAFTFSPFPYIFPYFILQFVLIPPLPTFFAPFIKFSLPNHNGQYLRPRVGSSSPMYSTFTRLNNCKALCNTSPGFSWPLPLFEMPSASGGGRRVFLPMLLRANFRKGEEKVRNAKYNR